MKMSTKKIINESIAKNPLGLKEVFEEAIMERVALALEAKKLDKVNPDALKGDFEDREDKDIDNDGDVDDSDEYLHNRRKTIMKAMKKESVDLDEASERVVAKKGNYTFVNNDEDETVHVKLRGKAIASGQFDIGADGWWFTIKGQRGQKFFREPEDAIKFFMKESVGLDEAKMSDIDVLRAARRLASVGKDDKTKEFGRGLLAFHTKHGSFTPAQVSGLQNIMKNAGFQFAKESVDLSEANASKIIKDLEAGDSIDVIVQKNLNRKTTKDDILKVIRDYNWKKRMKKESVEIYESHFNVGDGVECTASGMTGKVVKVDPEEKGKYYTVKREDGKMVKYAPEELKALNEVSKQTLASYINKASDASKHRNLPTKKVDNRYAGVHLASKKLDKKFNESINESKEYEKLGAEAFKAGIKRQVVLDPKMKKVFDTKQITDADLDAMKAWYKGWDRENLK